MAQSYKRRERPLIDDSNVKKQLNRRDEKKKEKVMATEQGFCVKRVDESEQI